MKGSQKLIVGAIVAIAIAIGVWRFYDPGPLVVPPEQQTTQTGCTRPPSLARVDDRKLKVAATQVGKIAVGEVNLEQKTEVVDVLSETGDKMLVFDYLMCEARARGEVNPTEPAQAERVRIITAFLATNPTAAEFIRLQELLNPAKPQARLVIPELSTGEGKPVLVLTEPVQTLSLSNAGDAEMLAWVRNESPGRLMVSPGQPAKLAQHSLATVSVSLVAPADAGPLKLRYGSSAANDEADVEVRVQASAKVTELLTDVANELQAKAEDAPEAPPSGAAPGTADASAGAQWLAERTRDVVKRKYPQTSDEAAWAVAGSLLEQMNWNAPAVAAYRASRASLGTAAAELDAPLSRAQVLANITADPARQEKPPEAVLKKEDIERLSSLQLASSNALVTSRPELARSLSEALGKKPSLAPFASGLRGDVALVSGTPQAAVTAFDECAKVNSALSCNLRKAEAQAKLKDGAAVNATIAAIAAQTPPAQQAVTRDIAVRARQKAATISR